MMNEQQQLLLLEQQQHRLMGDAVDRIVTMRKMETSYRFQSFVQKQQWHAGGKVSPLSETWRSKVTQWAFNVVDHFGLSREVVAVSMGIFDRYLATQGNLCSGNTVLLTSLTTLHLAIKLHETKRIKSCVLANLSRGQFDTAHIDEMEMKILFALAWKLHPPTPLAFCSEFLILLPGEISAAERKEVYELSKYVTELAVCESTFVERQNSMIALAAIRNVMESMKFARLSADAKEGFLLAISDIMGHTYESHTMRDTRERLKTMFAKVSATDCYFDGSYAAAGHEHYYNQKTPATAGQGGTRTVSPSGSPFSTTSSQYDIIAGGGGGNRLDLTTSRGCYNVNSSMYHQGNSTSSRTNFWYTPSPPHARALGVKVAQGGRGAEVRPFIWSGSR